MQLTTEVFQKVLPKQFRGRIDQDTIDKINTTFSDTTLMEEYRDNLIGYAHVLKDGRFKVDQYIDAVRYVGFKLMGNTNIDAYVKTFPARYSNHIANKISQKDLASYITSYNKNKLVNLIREQTLIPTHILNTDVYQEAINVQAKLMRDEDVSPKVRSDAANSLLTHLKAPEAKMEIDVTIKQDSTLQALRDTTQQLVDQQLIVLESKSVSVQTIAHSKLIQGDVVEGELV